MKFGSLFSGIGGFDLGFERAGMECAWQCEIDKNCQSLLQQKFGVKTYDDVRTITAGNTEPVELICGGFPCQDVSIAGKRAGFAGERSGLWTEFARIIDELKPKWVVIENVPGLLSSNQGRDFRTVLDQMVESGYGVSWRILDAQYFGVAQRRRRVFIIGSLGNGRSAEVLFEREGVRWNPPARGKTGEATTGETSYSLTFCDENGTRKDRPNGGLYVNETDKSNTLAGAGEGGIKVVSGYRMTAFGEYADDDKAGALKQRDWKDATDLVAFQRSQLRLSDKLDMVDVASTLKSETKSGDTELTVCWEMQHATEAYREAGDISPNLQARMGTGGNNVPLVGVRRLTPTECERLQGFPDGWTAGQSDSTRYRQLGNAVAVPVAEWIGGRIVEAMR